MSTNDTQNPVTPESAARLQVVRYTPAGHPANAVLYAGADPAQATAAYAREAAHAAVAKLPAGGYVALTDIDGKLSAARQSEGRGGTMETFGNESTRAAVADARAGLQKQATDAAGATRPLPDRTVVMNGSATDMNYVDGAWRNSNVRPSDAQPGITTHRQVVERMQVVDGGDHLAYSDTRGRRGWQQPLDVPGAVNEVRSRDRAAVSHGETATAEPRVIRTLEAQDSGKAKAPQGAVAQKDATPYSAGKTSAPVAGPSATLATVRQAQPQVQQTQPVPGPKRAR